MSYVIHPKYILSEPFCQLMNMNMNMNMNMFMDMDMDIDMGMDMDKDMNKYKDKDKNRDRDRDRNNVHGLGHEKLGQVTVEKNYRLAKCIV